MTIERQSTGPSSVFKGLTAPPPASIDTDRYRRDGFALVEGFLSDEELEALRAESTRICREELAPVTGAGNGDKPGRLDATKGRVLTGTEVLRQFLCIHFPHKVSAIMLGLLSHPQAVDNLVELIGPDVKAMQSMLFVKSEGKPGQAWHQDEYFIPDPRPVSDSRVDRPRRCHSGQRLPVGASGLSSCRRHLPRTGDRRRPLRLHDRGVPVPLPGRRFRPCRSGGGDGPYLQRLPASSVLAQHARPVACAGPLQITI